MSKFFEDIKKGLEQAVDIKNGKIPLKEREGMPAPTFFVEEATKEEKNEKINNRDDFS